jgi:hypothetical protein
MSTYELTISAVYCLLLPQWTAERAKRTLSKISEDNAVARSYDKVCFYHTPAYCCVSVNVARPRIAFPADSYPNNEAISSSAVIRNKSNTGES